MGSDHFGVYFFGGRPNELNSVKLPGLSDPLEHALASAPRMVKEAAEELLNEVCAPVTRIVAPCAIAHAIGAITKNSGDISDVVDAAYAAAQSGNVRGEYCAHTTRLKARELARAGHFIEATTLFEQIIKERDAKHPSSSDASARLDKIEHQLLSFCIPGIDQARYDAGCSLIAKNLAEFGNTLGHQSGVLLARSLFWTAHHYARLPLCDHGPLMGIARIGVKLLIDASGPKVGVIEAYRLLGSIALEHGEHAKSVQYFSHALKIPEVQEEELSQADFMHARGWSSVLAGGEAYPIGLLDLNEVRKLFGAVNSASPDPSALFYHLEFVDALLLGWRIKEARQVLETLALGILQDSESLLKARYYSALGFISDLCDQPEVSTQQLEHARQHIENIETVEASGRTIESPMAQVLGALNQLHLRDSLPLLVNQLELRTARASDKPDSINVLNEQIGEVERYLEQQLLRDRSPWVQLLLCRTELCAVRLSRLQGNVSDARAGLKSITKSIASSQFLRRSTIVGELMLEDGLQRVTSVLAITDDNFERSKQLEEQIPKAVASFNAVITECEKLAPLSNGLLLAARYALLRIYRTDLFNHQDMQRAAQHLEEIKRLNLNYSEYGEDASNFRDHLNRRYLINFAFQTGEDGRS